MKNKILAAVCFLFGLLSLGGAVWIYFLCVAPPSHPFLVAYGLSAMALIIAFAASYFLLFKFAMDRVRADAEADDSSE